MMKIGISADIAHTTPEEWEQKVKKLGSTCVVFPGDYRSDINTIDQYVKIAKQNNWVIGEVGAWSNPVSSDPNEQKAAMEKCVEQLKLADYVGAKCCVNITGAAGSRWDGPYDENFSEAHYDKVVTTIQSIIDQAKPKNTCYTIEPMPWMVPTGPKEYQKLIQDVGRKELKVHMDLTNWMCSYDRVFQAEKFVDKIYELLGSQIVSCHLKDICLIDKLSFMIKEVACGEGRLNLEYYIQKMLLVDPDMTFYIEHLEREEDYLPSMKYLTERLQKSGLL